MKKRDIPGPEVFESQMESGHMALTLDSLPGWNSASLFAMAQRRNPRRAFLFVSKVLGRHIPCDPALIRQAFSDLARQIPTDLHGPILVTGMAETAVGLAAGVHDVLTKQHNECVLLTTTRHPLGGDLLCRFEEEHSHATAHLVHLPTDPVLREHVMQAKTLVMVDDEATTGKTFANLLTALKEAGLNTIEHVIIATLTDWSSDKVSQQLGLPVTAVSLAKGSWHWTPALHAVDLNAPSVNVTAKGSQPLNQFAAQWGRTGVLHHQRLLSANPPQPQERILVLGSGEYVWQPFLLAEWLAEQGAHVRFGSTTRSPVALGHAITRAFSFNDNYGLGVPMFLYNVVPEEYDRVILCSETPASAWDPDFLAHFSRLEIIEA